PGSGQLHWDAGRGLVAIPMLQVLPNVYSAVFPALPCGSSVHFYFSAQTTGGDTVTNPLLAPQQVHAAYAASSMQAGFSDSFQLDQGWSVSGNAADGQWQRGVPVPSAICDRGAPGSDADASGACYLTDNDPLNCNSDVDTGSTTLTSPPIDISPGGALVSY